MNNCNHNNRGFWIELFIGGLLVAILLFLMTTKEGKKLAERLMEKIESLADDLENNMDEVKDKAVEIKEKINEKDLEKLDTAFQDLRHRFFSKNGKKLA